MTNPILSYCLNRNSSLPYYHYIFENIQSNNDLPANKIKALYKNLAENDIAKHIVEIVGIKAYTTDTMVVKFLHNDQLGFHGIGGVYHINHNTILIGDDNRLSVVLHEHTHQTMHFLFGTSTNPYSNEKDRTLYEKEILATLSDIKASLSLLTPHNQDAETFAKDMIKELGLDCGKIIPKTDLIAPDKPEETPVKSDIIVAKDFIYNSGFITPITMSNIRNVIFDTKKNNPTLDTMVYINPNDETAISSAIAAIMEEANRGEKTQLTTIEQYNFQYSNALYQPQQEIDIVDDFLFSVTIPITHASEHKFLCIFESYPKGAHDSETIAAFYELSIHHDVSQLFPHIYSYHQEVILPQMEEFKMEHTGKCPNPSNLDW